MITLVTVQPFLHHIRQHDMHGIKGHEKSQQPHGRAQLITRWTVIVPQGIVDNGPAVHLSLHRVLGTLRTVCGVSAWFGIATHTFGGLRLCTHAHANSLHDGLALGEVPVVIGKAELKLFIQGPALLQVTDGIDIVIALKIRHRFVMRLQKALMGISQDIARWIGRQDR